MEFISLWPDVLPVIDQVWRKLHSSWLYDRWRRRHLSWKPSSLVPAELWQPFGCSVQNDNVEQEPKTYNKKGLILIFHQVTWIGLRVWHNLPKFSIKTKGSIQIWKASSGPMLLYKSPSSSNMCFIWSRKRTLPIIKDRIWIWIVHTWIKSKQH